MSDEATASTFPVIKAGNKSRGDRFTHDIFFKFTFPAVLRAGNMMRGKEERGAAMRIPFRSERLDISGRLRVKIAFGLWPKYAITPTALTSSARLANNSVASAMAN